MPTGRIEHANLSVTDPQRSARLMQTLCGRAVRWQGEATHGGTTVHVGTAESYMAFYSNPSVSGSFSKGQPLNHVGLQVDDLDGAEQVVSYA